MAYRSRFFKYPSISDDEAPDVISQVPETNWEKIKRENFKRQAQPFNKEKSVGGGYYPPFSPDNPYKKKK